MRSVLCIGILVAELFGGRMTLPPVEIRSVVRGAYEIFKSGAQVGREDLVRTTFSNNTTVYESVYQVMEGDATAVTGNNRLEVEDDSGFPRSYYTYRRTEGAAGESVREISVRMRANVASVSERQGSVEYERRLVLPAGCLFVEGNIAHHIHLILDRYDRGAGGKQIFRALDPLGLGTADVALEYDGETAPADSSEGSASSGSSGRLSRYRYYTGGSFAADVFANAEGTVTRIDAAPTELEYVWKENRQ